MIKELLLSLAVAAASGVSFVGSPKRAQYPSAHFYTEIYYNNGGYCDIWFNNGEDTERLSQDDSKTLNVTGLGTCEAAFGYELPQNYDDCYIYFNIYPPFRPSVDWTCSNNAVTMSVEQDGSDYYIEFGLDGAAAFDWADRHERFTLECTITEYVDQTYTITKNLYNCSINSTPELPQTYTNPQVGQTFVIYGAANSDLAGDYGFNSSSLSVTGASATALSLTNEIGNSGYYRGCSFSVTLPANSFTISLTAYRPSFSITSTLNNCTVSPSIPSSYSGMFAEDFTFTAEQGFYFNKNVAQWEFTGGVVAQEPEYIGFVWGTLYQSVKIRLVFDAGNANIRVSGVAYTIDSYQQGWKDGDKSGYDRGHADGLVAGDSYGVWNWLKQAARTTGEFFNIPLLPGFSVGALLTALAGLMIIWLFIKGFLFKS